MNSVWVHFPVSAERGGSPDLRCCLWCSSLCKGRLIWSHIYQFEGTYQVPSAAPANEDNGSNVCSFIGNVDSKKIVPNDVFLLGWRGLILQVVNNYGRSTVLRAHRVGSIHAAWNCVLDLFSFCFNFHRNVENLIGFRISGFECQSNMPYLRKVLRCPVIVWWPFGTPPERGAFCMQGTFYVAQALSFF